MRRFRGVVRLFVAGVLVAATNSAWSASLTPVSGTLTANLLANISPFFLLALDVRGTAIFEVNNPGPIGLVLMSDQGAPVPNSVLLVDDAGGQQLNLTFDPNSLVLGLTTLINATGIPVGTVTDPELLALQRAIQCAFALTGVQSSGNTEQLTFNFASAQTVPEPGCFNLLGIGFLGVVSSRLKHLRRK
jgi:hypothetical protein